jgi:hypothetical protein
LGNGLREMLNSVGDKLRPDEPGTEEKTEQLNRMLRCRALQNSESLRALLQYVASRVIEGQDSQVKEYTIAVEVFGRSKDFNASTDSLVRVQAKRLREKLKEYYETEGKDDKVLIDLPKGHYTAVFSYIQREEPLPDPPPAQSLEPPPIGLPAPAPSQVRNERFSRVLLSMIAMILALAVVVLAYSNHTLRKQAVSPIATAAQIDDGAVWSPFIDSRFPVMLILSNPPVYRFTNASDPEVVLKHSLELNPEQSSWLTQSLSDRFVTRQTEKPRLVLSTHEYTGVGESIGLYQLAGMFRNFGKAAAFKQSRTVSPQDLKENNVVLLGSVWANVWSGKLPVKEDFTYTLNATIENNNPKAGEEREYRLGFNPATGDLIKDYALITVRPAVTDENLVMVLSGIKSEGTQAAAEVVTNKEYLSILNQRLKQLSEAGSPPKYYQVLLQVDVDNEIPTTVSIIAIHPLQVTRH